MGKDLSRVCLPVYFNEPLSALQRIAEEMEYSELLDQVHACTLVCEGSAGKQHVLQGGLAPSQAHRASCR